ncbi:hypothetical protein [Methanobacterium sp.]|uniref:hypothetical protein n=1 Tax=Methanobacterium sp. TaxID=2164 RepID=UPI003C72B5EF
MVVNIYYNGVRIGNGTKYDDTLNEDVEETETFDGVVLDPGIAKYEFTISRVISNDPRYEDILENELRKKGGALTVEDTTAGLTDHYTQCYVTSRKGSKDPRKRRSEDITFKAQSRTRKWR